MLFARGGRLAGGAVAPASVIDWARLKRAFGAINNDVDSNSPDDIAYVTSGYAPTFARVVEWVCRHHSLFLCLLPLTFSCESFSQFDSLPRTSL